MILPWRNRNPIRRRADEAGAPQQVLGLSKDELPDLQTTEEIHDYLSTNLVGQRAAINLSVVSKDGQERNRVKRITGLK